MPGYELQPHYLDRDLTGLRLIKFNEQYSLELAEQRTAVDHWHNFRCAEDHVLAVSMTVGAFVGAHADGTNFEIVVAVLDIFRSDTFEKVFHILKEERLVLVDDD